MTSSFGYRQLVLFDCDDGRLSLFKNHEKYLSRIPSNCECYIFWNDFKFPVYKRFKLLLQKYSYIHLCPYYCETNDLHKSNLLFYLGKLKSKFSFILLVHGDDWSFEKVFRCIRKRYGEEKIDLKAINYPFSQHLPHIIGRLRKENRQYTLNKSPKKLFLNGQLKYRRDSLLSNGVWINDTNPLPYAYEEYTNFKYITKQKQKNLEIYYHNISLYGTTLISAVLDISDEDEEENDYLSIMSLIESSVEESVEFNLSSTTQPSNLDPNKKTTKQEKVSKKTKSSIHCKKKAKAISINNSSSNVQQDRKTVNQEHVQMATTKKKSKKQQCNSEQTHDTFWYMPNQASAITNQKLTTPNKKKTKERVTYFPQNLISCSKCSKKFGSTASRDTHFNVKHAESKLSTNTKPRSSRNSRSTMVKDKPTNVIKYATVATEVPLCYWQCSKMFESSSARINSFNTKCAESNVSTNTEPASFFNNRSTMIDEAKTIVHTQISVRTVRCSECCQKFKNTNDRFQHFIHVHATSFQSETNDLPTHDNDCKVIVQDAVGNQKTMINFTKQSFDCWECAKKFEVKRRFTNHFIEVHILNVIRTTDTVTPSFLDNQLLILKERMKTLENTSASTKTSLDCSSYTNQAHSTSDIDQQQHKTINDPSDAMSTQHLSSSIETKLVVDEEQSKLAQATATSICLSFEPSEHQVGLELVAYQEPVIVKTHPEASNIGNNSNITAQEQIQIIQHRNEPVHIFSCWKCSKKFKTVHRRLYHFLENHSGSFLPIVNALSSHSNGQMTMVGKQTCKSNVSINPLDKSCSCWICGKNFKSHGAQVSHFIGIHTQAILLNDTDPSSTLKNQIEKAQEQMNVIQDTTVAAKASLCCRECSKMFKSNDALINHFNAKHAGSTLFATSNLPKPLYNQTPVMRKRPKIKKNTTFSVKEYISTTDDLNNYNVKDIKCVSSTVTTSPNDVEDSAPLMQKRTENTGLQTNSVNIPYYCQQESANAAKNLELFKTEYTRMKSSDTTIKDPFTDRDIMKCPRAKFPTLVYMLLGSFRKHICVTLDKTNRCSHEVCKMRTANYGFEELWSHIIMEHKDVQLRLECCSPMIMYTLEEYKNHLLQCD